MSRDVIHDILTPSGGVSERLYHFRFRCKSPTGQRKCAATVVGVKWSSGQELPISLGDLSEMCRFGPGLRAEVFFCGYVCIGAVICMHANYRFRNA